MSVENLINIVRLGRQLTPAQPRDVCAQLERIPAMERTIAAWAGSQHPPAVEEPEEETGDGMELLDCPKRMSAPVLLDGVELYCCGIFAVDARRWNNYVYAMQIALSVTYSKYANQPLDMEEVDECWLWFDSTYNAEPEEEE